MEQCCAMFTACSESWNEAQFFVRHWKNFSNTVKMCLWLLENLYRQLSETEKGFVSTEMGVILNQNTTRLRVQSSKQLQFLRVNFFFEDLIVMKKLKCSLIDLVIGRLSVSTFTANRIDFSEGDRQKQWSHYSKWLSSSLSNNTLAFLFLSFWQWLRRNSLEAP